MSPLLIFALTAATPAADPVPPSVPALTQQLSSSNAVTRSRAALALGGYKEQAEAAVPHLIRALADPDPFVARDAAIALGQIGPGAAPALRANLRHPDPRIRHRVLQALSGACPRDRHTVVALARTLRSDPDREIRRWAALALDRIGLTFHGIYANATAAAVDPDRSVRMSALLALLHYSATVTEIAATVVCVAQDRDATRRAAATAAVRRFSNRLEALIDPGAK